jgi:hypothetical protein
MRLTHHFWTEERGLTSMLILLCIGNFILSPFIEHQKLLHIIARIVWLILLFDGITTLTRKKSRFIFLFYSAPVMMIVVNVVQMIIGGEVLAWLEFVVSLGVFAVLIGLVMARVFAEGEVTIHRVLGAILAYMLIGNLGAVIFQFMYQQNPGSFSIPAVYSEKGPDITVFLYFSYTTLTTTGYGEITPVYPFARNVVHVMQLLGVLYPAVLIGRLVGMVVGKK